VDKVISHAKSNLNDQWTVEIKILVEIYLLIVLKSDAVAWPPFAQRFLLTARHLAAVAKIAGGPSELPVSFQVRHFKIVTRSVFYEHVPLDNK